MCSRPPRRPGNRARRRSSMRNPSPPHPRPRPVGVVAPALALALAALVAVSPRPALAQKDAAAPKADKAAGVFDDAKPEAKADKPAAAATDKPEPTAGATRDALGFTQENAAQQ